MRKGPRIKQGIDPSCRVQTCRGSTGVKESEDMRGILDEINQPVEEIRIEVVGIACAHGLMKAHAKRSLTRSGTLASLTFS